MIRAPKAKGCRSPINFAGVRQMAMVTLPYHGDTQLPPIQFQFAHVEQALAAMHQVADDRRSAFQARLKHYQKQGFPPGINTGRGRAATYRAHHALKLAFALELNQMGLSPERAAEICEGNIREVYHGFESAVRSLLADDGFPTLLHFDPASLSDLRSKDDPDETTLTLKFSQGQHMRQQFDDWTQSYFRRAAIINTTRLVEELAYTLGAASKLSPGTILEAMLHSLRHRDADGNPQT